MPKEYSKEEWWKLYEKIPDELKRALFSADNAQSFSEICKRYGILDKAAEIGKYISRVFLGVLPVDEFKVILREELKFDERLAKEVFHDINRFIFLSVKGSLAALYETGTPGTPETPRAPGAPDATPPKKPASTQEDVYREPIE